MRRTNLFIKTSKTSPSDEVAKNAQLLIRAGYVYKVMAGVYAYTPLGLMVIENIKQIVREEMNGIGAHELLMSSLQRRDTWEGTGRWSDDVVDIWFKSKLKDGSDVGFGWSHEEPIIEMLKTYLQSYKDLPIYVYQFQNKLRNELRAKSGIMRGREFLMKDMYSCSVDSKTHDEFYNATIEAYNRVFDRLGIGDDTYMTFASGGAFTQFSHEFQTVCEAGEDIIYIDREKNIAVNEEVLDDKTMSDLGIKRENLEKVKTAEVGNIFNFNTQKSQEMDFGFTDKEGKKQFVHLGSYGIGISRLMGVLVEKLADDKGIVWPASVAPYKMALVSIGGEKAAKWAEETYKELVDRGIKVLYDDRDVHAGQKFNDSELMGIPYRVALGDRNIESRQYEFTTRSNQETKLLTHDELIAKLSLL